MRKEHVVLRRRKFFQGRKIFGAFKDLMWLQPDGSEMNEETWNKAKIRVIGMMLVGYGMDEFNQHGERISDDTILVSLNEDNKQRCPLHRPGAGRTTGAARIQPETRR
jgi:isoamylase